jgi:phage shock protein C
MKKKLKRDEEQAVVSGVLAGMANFWNQDPVLFRVLAITFLILTGVFPGLLLYVAAWVVMPADTGKDSDVDYEIVE